MKFNATGTSRRLALASGLAWAVVGQMQAHAQPTYFDTTFAPSDWSSTFLAQPRPPGGGGAAQLVEPAPRGSVLQIAHTLGGVPPSEVLSVHINTSVSYNPKTDCPIEFVNFSALARTVATEAGTYGGGVGPALRQDGRLYVADFLPTRTNPAGTLPSPYIPRSYYGLTTNSFRLVLGPGVFDNTQHPNFSRSGTHIQFGFAVVNSHTGPSTITRVTAIDDWTFTLGQQLSSFADFGDAPDGSLGMTTGYYGFNTVGGIVYTLASRSGPASFPTIIGNSGPFSISPDLYVFPAPPSLEQDAIGPYDADGAWNLFPLADDADNDLFEPGASMLLIFAVASRPPAMFFTIAASSASGPPNGFWNLAFDLDQDGDWGPGEWVVQDMPFAFPPGSFQLLSSPHFFWGPPGQQFGRLTFPVWMRNMVTSEAVSTNTPLSGPPGQQYYAGAGPLCGFTFGEVEDTFLEWFPIGQYTTNEPPNEITFGPDIPADHLAGFHGPEIIALDRRVEYVISGPALRRLTIVHLPNGTNGGAAGVRLSLVPGEIPTGRIETDELIAEAELSAAGDKLYLTPRHASAPATLVVYGEPADLGIPGPGVPAGPSRTPIVGAGLIQVDPDAVAITGIRNRDGRIELNWSAGTGPYRVQRAARLGDPWIDVLTTDATVATVKAVGQAEYFRVLSRRDVR